ncbi:hypothetical protein M569_05320 [Genlisea aurea]|uniref:Uncharacterized protein n=1 Tax=Genlisea aurea TaxID=192259 RepID=S8CQL1_9LAMI|nr:hypothetical protein M569_05320 [Genlisea aurea]
MGAACCIAAKNKNTGNGSSGASANVQIHSRYSPSWSFRWDNRGRVAGEDTSVDWLDSRVRENDRATLKSSAEATLASDDGSLLDSFRSVTWQKSPPSQGNDKSLMPPSSGPGVSRNPEQVCRE